jgi:hypothetical protein
LTQPCKRPYVFSLLAAVILFFAGAATISASAGISVIPSSVNFGYVSTGVTNTQTVTLKNSGTTPLYVSGVTVKGTGFSLSGVTVPTNIAIQAGRVWAFTLRFSPTVVGAASGNISITSNAPNPVTSVAVQGHGEFPSLHLSVNTTALNFGSVNVGSYLMKPVTLSNNGNANLTVSAIKVSGTGFSTNGYLLPITLAIGQSANFNVEFKPGQSGSATGSVAVTSTASSTPASVSLSGSGIVSGGHLVDLTWLTGSAKAVGYHVYRATSSAGPFARLTSSLIVATTYTDTTVQSSKSYFYVATSVDAQGIESGFSNEISVAIP